MSHQRGGFIANSFAAVAFGLYVDDKKVSLARLRFGAVADADSTEKLTTSRFAFQQPALWFPRARLSTRTGWS